MKNKIKKLPLKAFSLLELSVVLIIIGITVSGITTGSSLVRSYKLSSARSITNSSTITAIPNLILWFDSANKNALTNQNGLKTIHDQDTIKSWSSSHIDSEETSISQDDTAKQPTYYEYGGFGLPIVRFAPGNPEMNLTGAISSSYNTESTIFIVFTWEMHNDTDMTLLSIKGDNAKHEAAVESNQFVFFSEAGGIRYDALSYPPLANIETVILLSRYYNPSTNISTLYINGETGASSTATVNSTYGLNASLRIANNSELNRPFGGSYAEIIIFDRALKKEEINFVHQYLNRKWHLNLKMSPI